jgi:histidine phosphotransfer protein HptB
MGGGGLNMREKPSLNEVVLGELRELLADNFNELISRYITDTQSRFDLLQQAVTDMDFKAIHYEAHGIKGSSRNMGANPLADIMDKLEALGREHNAHNVANLLEEAKAEYQRVVHGLAYYRAASPSV